MVKKSLVHSVDESTNYFACLHLLTLVGTWWVHVNYAQLIAQAAAYDSIDNFSVTNRKGISERLIKMVGFNWIMILFLVDMYLYCLDCLYC